MALTERLYLHDSKQLEFPATVTDIREFARRDGVQIWQLALDRTAFYPTSGGQPHDTGELRARARSGAEITVRVDEVVEDESGEIWHATTKPLLTGTEIVGCIDGRRRRDHMQQHSGQHLLSAVLAEDYGAQTVGFHLGDEDTTIDLAVEGKEEQGVLLSHLAAAERAVNECILNNLPVSVSSVSNTEAQALLATGAIRKLPPREGDIRLVEIPGLDRNACGGTHVESLGEIGIVLLRETERIKRGVRLHFLCGGRAVRAAQRDWAELSATAALLSVGLGNVSDAVHRLQAEARGLGKDRLRLREEIAASLAVQLAVEERIQNGIRVVSRTFTDRDAEYTKLIATKLLEAVPQTVAVLVAAGQETPTIVIASNMEAAAMLPGGCNSLLREVLAPYGLRGGGTAEMAQAAVPVELVDPLRETLVRKLSGR